MGRLSHEVGYDDFTDDDVRHIPLYSGRRPVMSRAHADGRGITTPFALSTKDAKALAGETVRIGDMEIKVTRDGHLNIPKSIMSEYGAEGDDGRRRIGLAWLRDTNGSWLRDTNGSLIALPYTPRGVDVNAETGDLALSWDRVVTERPSFQDSDILLVPCDMPDWWYDIP